jgi:PPP family 3-phenylpropionic acid transporter
MSLSSREPKGRAIALYYLLQYSTIGVTLPFLPQYLKTLGFSSTGVGVLLALSPVLSLVAPPLWGQLVDRTGQAGRVLLLLTFGSAAAFSLLLWVHGYVAVLFAMLLVASFSSAISTLADAMSLRHVAREGGSFSRIRLWGSAGFAAASLLFGRLVTQIDATVVRVPLMLMGLSTTWVLVALSGATVARGTGPRPTLSSALALAADPELKLFLAAVALHWLACAPYHSALSIHVTALHLPPNAVGDTATVGVVAEVLVMTTWPRWGHRVRPYPMLVLSFVASSVRWLGMALTSDGTVLTALAVLHGLTFGTFYLASIAIITERVPDSLRATGQALFTAAVYGVGGLVGYVATGIGIDLFSTHTVFGAAAVLELVPTALVLLRTQRTVAPAVGS